MSNAVEFVANAFDAAHALHGADVAKVRASLLERMEENGMFPARPVKADSEAEQGGSGSSSDRAEPVVSDSTYSSV